MNTLADLLRSEPESEVNSAPIPGIEVPPPAEITSRQSTTPLAEHFAGGQIQSLVRRIFFSSRGKPARHILFSAVEEKTYVAELCMRAAEALAEQISGSVCLVEANLQNPELETVFAGPNSRPTLVREGMGLRSECKQMASNLWLAPLRVLLGGVQTAISPTWLERRVSDFRLEFDYTVFHAAPSAQHDESAFLGNLVDGVVLVLQANSTRRLAAQRTREMLQALHVRLLGAVLMERTFPIPEKIYRRL
jgi:succinoglycan biosynthesis transport protein ExoP